VNHRKRERERERERERKRKKKNTETATTTERLTTNNISHICKEMKLSQNTINYNVFKIFSQCKVRSQF
jgi:hypothetical protein